MPTFDQVAILGVGLLGGSIGKALLERQLANEVIGVGRNQAKLAHAESLGIVQRTTTELAAGVAEADLVVVCTPVDSLADNVASVLRKTKESCLVTDVGSTKQAIVRAVDEQCGPDASRFIGSHPMAGDHRAGADYARADLFVDRMVVITPGDSNKTESIDRVADFWRSLGARTMLLGPGEHDSAVAVTSHLPHAVATATALATSRDLLDLAATGWADTTRIAAGDPKLWREIFMTNREQVLSSFDHFQIRFSALRKALEDGDGDLLEELLTEGKQIRDAMGN